MLNTLSIFLLFFTSSFAVGAQEFLVVDTVKYIEWEETVPLTWEDYVLKENARRDYALTSVIHSIRGGLTNGKPDFEIKVLFVKKDSWITTIENKKLLLHEQLHFDMAELYGRKIRKQIESLHAQKVDDLKVYRKAVKALLGQFKEKSKAYDEETKHGTSFSKQKEWNDYVSSELKRLANHKSMK